MPISKNAALRYRLIDECLCRLHVQWTRARLLQEVSDKFEEVTGKTVSPRQLDQDIQAMKLGGSSGLDAPLEYDRKANTYYYTEAGFSIRNSPLVVDDAEVLRQALAVLQQFQGLGLSEELNELVARVEKQVNLHGRPVTTPSLLFEQVSNYRGADKLRPLYEAIRRHQVLELHYLPFWAEEPLVLEVHPYLLKEFNHRWFLLAHCDGASCLQTYALDRIQQITPTATAYQSQQRPDPEQYFQHVIGPSVDANGHVEKVRLRFRKSRAPYVLTKPLHHSQQVVETGENCVDITIHVIPNRELVSLLLGFGPDLNVLSPFTLRQEVARKHRESVDCYVDCDTEELKETSDRIEKSI